MKKKTRIFLGILSVMVVLLVAAYLLIPTKNSTTVSNFILQRRLLKLLIMVIDLGWDAMLKFSDFLLEFSPF